MAFSVFNEKWRNQQNIAPSARACDKACDKNKRGQTQDKVAQNDGFHTETRSTSVQHRAEMMDFILKMVSFKRTTEVQQRRVISIHLPNDRKLKSNWSKRGSKLE